MAGSLMTFTVTPKISWWSVGGEVIDDASSATLEGQVVTFHSSPGTHPLVATIQNGEARFTVSAAPGVHQYWATMSFTSTQTGEAYIGESSKIQVTVPKIAANVALKMAEDGRSLTTTVSGAIDYAKAPTGTVRILDNGSLLAEVSLTEAARRLALTPGSHRITAAYVGDPNYLEGTSAPLEVTYTSTGLAMATAAPVVGQLLTLVAYVTPGVAGTVTFRDGATTLGVAQVNQGEARLTVAAPAAGAREFRADFAPVNAFGSSGALSARVYSPQIVDVLVLYTREAMIANPDLYARILDQVRVTNDQLLAKQSPVSVRLVSAAPIRKEPAAGSGVSTVVWADVQAISRRVGADLVLLADLGEWKVLETPPETPSLQGSVFVNAQYTTATMAQMSSKLLQAMGNAGAVASAAASTAAPIGSVESWGTGRVKGWALDPKAYMRPAQIWVAVDGRAVGMATANGDRADLAAAFGSGAHGFDITLPLQTAGVHTVSVYAYDLVTGGSVLLATNTLEMGSPVFDEAYYLKNNPDVAAAAAGGKITAWEHFKLSGQYELRNPSVYFNTAVYLDQNPDVAAVYASGGLLSPFGHFAVMGQYEDRTASLYFDARYYRRANPDVQAALPGLRLSAVEHFRLSGQAEGRSPLPYFSAAEPVAGAATPLAAQGAVIPSSDGPTLSPLAWFSEAAYRALNPDVTTAISRGSVSSGLEHFLRTGRAEGRRFSTAFSEGSYLAHNPDVANAVRKGLFSSGFEHYLLAGIKERRAL